MFEYKILENIKLWNVSNNLYYTVCSVTYSLLIKNENKLSI